MGCIKMAMALDTGSKLALNGYIWEKRVEDNFHILICTFNL
ncbi:hypothetical protein BROSI_A1756 [Candidatus Brocadia sinica JPN1]|uniref:Uncharacterized protein n=1 Tax=Candidatus Brocadia sinica JPN1 TaxID=1197129 RepID=A0ABQ0JXN2_9BACT|nr:hypothetical protein BROSI_A1756 [Candidatus Brocadia sinica JPN1]